jgi:hypothetical protein
MGLGLSVGSYPMVDESSGPLIKFVEHLARNRAYSLASPGQPICGDIGRAGRHECGAEVWWRDGTTPMSAVVG